MNHNSILLSIKPFYAEKIFRGEKSVELRRKLPKDIKKGSLVLVYISSPKKMIYGAFTVKKIIDAPLNALWKKVSSKSCISKDEFAEYFSGVNNGYGIFIDDYWTFQKPISFEAIKTHDESFNIPQSFRYLKESELRFMNYKFGIVF
jgi:predicted transcriptional regulator